MCVCVVCLFQEKIVQNNLKAAEGDLELLYREKQQKINELYVVVPLRLNQVRTCVCLCVGVTVYCRSVPAF